MSNCTFEFTSLTFPVPFFNQFGFLIQLQLQHYRILYTPFSLIPLQELELQFLFHNNPIIEHMSILSDNWGLFTDKPIFSIILLKNFHLFSRCFSSSAGASACCLSRCFSFFSSAGVYILLQVLFVFSKICGILILVQNECCLLLLL